MPQRTASTRCWTPLNNASPICTFGPISGIIGPKMGPNGKLSGRSTSTRRTAPQLRLQILRMALRDVARAALDGAREAEHARALELRERLRLAHGGGASHADHCRELIRAPRMAG